MTRIRRILAGIGALVALLALLVGVPWLLCHFIGWPLPRRVPSLAGLGHDLSERGIPDKSLVDALAVVVWIVWALLAISVLAETVATIRGERAKRVPVAGRFQPLTGKLVAAVLVAVLALAPRNVSPRSTTAGMAPSSGRPVATAVLTDVQLAANRVPLTSPPVRESTTTSRAPAKATTALPSATHPYVVQRGDTLWGIAKRELGDPLRWREIAALNEGRHEGTGTFSDPHWIDPGWTLLLPGEGSTGSEKATAPTGASAPAPSNASPTSPSAEGTSNVPDPSSPTRPIAAPAASRPAGPLEPPTQHRDDSVARPASVRLPSGSVVGGSFAIGILSALALARLRRRRRYRYRPPLPGRALSSDPLRPTIRALVEAVEPIEEEGTSRVVAPPVIADADPDHRERPDFIEIGVRGGAVESLSLAGLAGVVVTGPTATDVLRAWVTALLTRAGPIAAELLTTDETLTEIALGRDVATNRPEVPGLRVVADLAVIRRDLEAEVTHRTHQFEEDGVDDIASYRRTYPWDPMPAVIALIDSIPTEDERAWRDLMEHGARCGVGALFLEGSVVAGTRIVIDEASVITSVQPETRSHALVGVRCFTLGAEETNDLIEVLVDAEERPTSDDSEPLGPFEFADAEEVPEPVGVERWLEIDAELGGDNAAAGDDASRPAPPIVVHLFGPCEIVVNGTVIEKGLRSVAKELLAWLALRPDGASIGAIVEGCWPDTERRLVNDTFWRAASDLRTKVGAIAEPRSRFVDQVGEVYRLDHASIECDLWQFQGALGVAAHSEDAAVARAALRSATSLFRGEFVEHADYRWVEPVREDLHRRALDAHLRLAELEEELGSLDAAESALDAAIELDRYAEEPYRRLMTLQGHRERIDAVTATWRRLERHLAEIDVDPEQTTTRLFRSLTSEPATSRLRLSS